MKIAVCALLMAAVPGAALAQVRVVRYGDDRLTGITEVDVLVSLAASPGCPIAREELAAAAGSLLRQAGIKATTSQKSTSWFYSVLIEVTTMPAGGACASAVTTELVAQVQAVPEADRSQPPERWGSWLVGPMPLLRFTDLVTSVQEEHDASVRQSARSRLLTIAGKIRAANP